jgi:hypothetical protein
MSYFACQLVQEIREVSPDYFFKGSDAYEVKITDYH